MAIIKQSSSIDKPEITEHNNCLLHVALRFSENCKFSAYCPTVASHLHVYSAQKHEYILSVSWFPFNWSNLANYCKLCIHFRPKRKKSFFKIVTSRSVKIYIIISILTDRRHLWKLKNLLTIFKWVICLTMTKDRLFRSLLFFNLQYKALHQHEISYVINWFYLGKILSCC